jgi:molybdopterin molybdotransferase
MTTPDAAWGLVLKHTCPLARISLPLDEALGHCLAETVRADRDLPPADRSAMDGYAVRAADLRRRPCVLRVGGEVAAGSPARPRIRPGDCARIFTGANVPPGADTVVLVEQTTETDGCVTIRSSARRGANIFQRGEDCRRGAALLRPGTVIGSTETGVCAAVGKAELRVHRRPRVALLCTGAELRAVGDRVASHELRNSNGPALAAALAQWGFAGASQRQVPDREAALRAALRRALESHDVVLFTGGMSVGKYDFVRAALEAEGAVVRFHGLAMKPAKPTLYATVGTSQHVFGLPGNPLSAMTACHEFALPALRRLAGCAPAQCRPALRLPLDAPLCTKPGRVRCVLARVSWDSDGPRVHPVESRSSADLVSAGCADGTIIVPADTANLAAGSLVTFRPWRPLP